MSDVPPTVPVRLVFVGTLTETAGALEVQRIVEEDERNRSELRRQGIQRGLAGTPAFRRR